VPVQVIDRRDDQERLSTRWWPLRWTSPLVGETPRPISLFDVAELRGVIDTNRVAVGFAPIQWVGRTDTDPTFVAGLTPIRAVHFMQLRQAIADLWGLAKLGPLPEFQAGPLVPGSRVISARDPLDLRGWLERYEQARPDLAARVALRYGLVPRVWPAADIDYPVEQPVEVWDATGHALLWSGSDPAKLTELRRIDSHWHRLNVLGSTTGTADAPRVEITGPRVSPSTVSGTLGPFPNLANDNDAAGGTVADTFGLRFLTWEPRLPNLQPDWLIDRDPLGRIVRLRNDTDAVLYRFAYDGLGRLRKWVDTVTWHVLGPDHIVPVGMPSYCRLLALTAQSIDDPV
jgi:YD repeat-containing protein